MACLALDPTARTPSAALASRTQVPADYLAKVLQQLSTSSLIEGRRGVGGGYRLLRTPENITLLDVINAVEPLKRISTCPLNIECHGPNLCPLHKRIDSAIAGVISVFEDSSLADLLVSEDGTQGGSIPLCDTQDLVNLSVRGRNKPSP